MSENAANAGFVESNLGGDICEGRFAVQRNGLRDVEFIYNPKRGEVMLRLGCSVLAGFPVRSMVGVMYHKPQPVKAFVRS